MSFWGPKTFVSHSEIAILTDDLPDFKISVRPGVGTTREAPIRNRHFDPVGRRSHSEISGPVQNSSPGAWSRAVDAIAYGHLFAQTCITSYS
ncbi:hypothetical protein Taro_033558, partial [Colocasia esculenta]|nr:hypothetical protein [Colocasia esculenta]